MTDEPQPAQSLAHADGAPSVDAPTPGRGSDGLGRLLDAAIAVFVAAYTLRGIGPHVRNAATRGLYADDVRIQVLPFLSEFADRHTIVLDYIRSIVPVGASLLYAGAESVGCLDALVRYGPYVNWFATAAALAFAAHRVAGRRAAILVVAIVLSVELYPFRTAGMLPRAFGFPLYAFGAAAVAAGRIRVLAIVTVVAAAVYPTASVVLGLTLAIVALAAPSASKIRDLPERRSHRLLLVAGTAVACAILLGPMVVRGAEYGPLITAEDFERIPEAGPGGRHVRADLPPFPTLVHAWDDQVDEGVLDGRHGWGPTVGRLFPDGGRIALFALGVLLALTLARDRRMARRVATILVALAVARSLAVLVAPRLHHPSRYDIYGVPPLAGLFIAAGFTLGVARVTRTLDSIRLREALRSAALFAATLLLIGRPPATAGLTVDRTESLDVYASLEAALPPDAVVAGWPPMRVQDLPYLSRRDAYLTLETHLCTHERYALAMRTRMENLIDVYSADDARDAVRRLVDDGVSHLLVEPSLYAGPPRYFEPFRSMAAEAFSRMPRAPAVVRWTSTDAATNLGGFYVLDLRAILEAESLL